MIPESLSLLLPPVGIFAALCIISFLGGAMRAFAGFGSSLLMAPLFSLFMPPTDVLVIILLLNITSTLQMLPGSLKWVDWKIVFSLFLPALFGIPLGLACLQLVDAVIIRRLVAIIVVLVAVILLAGWYYKGKRGWLQDSAAGLTSGVLSAIAGIGGPPIVLYLLSGHGLSPFAFRAVVITYFGMIQSAVLVPLFIGGSMTTTQFVYAGALLPAYVLATALGSMVHRRMAQTRSGLVRKVSLLLLLAIGMATLLI